MKNKKIELTEYEIEVIKDLKKQIKKTNGRCVIATIEHVSSSGESRIISFGYISKNQLLQINFLIEKILNVQRPKYYNGVKIGGCGMDMIFATLNRFYSKIGLKDDSLQYSSNYTRF